MNDRENTILYPHLVRTGVANTDKIADELANATSFTRGDIVGIITALSGIIARRTASGESVHLDGLGTFRAVLGMRAGSEYEESDGSTKRNASSIQIKRMNFRADKELIRRANASCQLERGRIDRVEREESRERRIALALEHLAEHPILTSRNYQHLTGLPQSVASVELRQLVAEGILEPHGYGPHRVYLLPSKEA